ncbi:hypothetical protein MMC31_000156 [Peltigera leucophlebia]|nr:hypothetical protein [Peltigera leucophlebia]
MVDTDECAPLKPCLAGTTGCLYQAFPPKSSPKGHAELDDDALQQTIPCAKESNYFKSALWSPDGTTILTSSADNTLRSFILFFQDRPVNLLDPLPQPHHLTPYSSHFLPEPCYSTAIHPSFSLQSPATTLFLASLRALPIRLLSPFSPNIVATYHLISPTTEAYITPHSLLFSPDIPNHFFAGSHSMVSTFDINRNGLGPLSRVHTTPSRRDRGSRGIKGGCEMGMKGIVSALRMSCEGLLAAGTFSRWIGLYDGYGRGGTMGVFEINGADPEGTDSGSGITQVLWSSCGRYLCVVERSSDGISVYDVRGTGRRLSWFRGRKARTNQRLGVDIFGNEIWAGGTDGFVRIWEGVGMLEGDISPSREVEAHDDAVSSTILHPCGAVLATCSGQRHSLPVPPLSIYEPKDESESDDEDTSQSSRSLSSSPSTTASSLSVSRLDNSLNVWSL